MKKFLIIAGMSGGASNTPYVKYFSQYLKGYEVEQLYLDELVVEISPDKFEVINVKTGQPINNYEIVMIREYNGQFLDLAFVVSKYLLAAGVPFFNKNYLNYRPLSKVAQAVLFYEQKVNFPKTFFSISPEYLVKSASHAGFPLILKDRTGMHGSHNYLAHSAEEAQTVLSQNSDVHFIAQEFLANSHDYRVLIMGDEQPLQIKRTAASGSHLNNTSQGGKGELVKELPEDVLEDVKKLAKAFQVDIAGVDVMPSGDKHYFLEVNNQPQIVTGAEVPAKMAVMQKFLDSF